MLTPEPNPLDDQFARLLAAHDEQLLTGRSKPNEEVTADLAPRLVQAQAFVELLDGAWRRHRTLGETPPEYSRTEDLTPLDELPATIGRFQIVRELGRGGGGVVYLAHDPALGRQVAVKVPRLEIILTPALRRRFLREGQTAALLNHPNINPIHEAGSAGSVCYIVSSYCSGPTLAQWLRDHPQPVAPRDAASLIERLAEAMAHAHQRGILHRDLKPSNILLQSGVVSGGAVRGKNDPTHLSLLTPHPSPLTSYQPKIADFGLAKVPDAEDVTGTGVLLGTAGYMAPEQSLGTKDLGPACDLWALGVILYEVLTRQKPFAGITPAEIMQAVQTIGPVAPRRLRPDVPPDLETICLKCLEKAPARRYESAAALADDLQRFLAHETIRARPAGAMERAVKWARRRPARAALAVLSCVMLALLAGGVAWYEVLDRSHQEERERRQAQEDGLRKDIIQREYVTTFRRAWQEWNKNAPERTLELLTSLKPHGKEADQRGFEWHFLFDRASHRPKHLLLSGPPVPEGQRGLTFPARALTMSADGTMLADCNDLGGIHLWDTSSWEMKWSLICNADLFSPAFSPDNKLLASVLVNLDATTQLTLWDVQSEREYARLREDLKPPHAVVFSPDGKTLAGISENQLYLWDVAPMRRRRAVVPREGLERFTCLLWSVGDRGPTLGSSDGFVLTCDGTTGEVLESWSMGTHIYSLAKAPDGKTLGAGVNKGVLLLPSNKLLDQVGATSMVFSADGRTLAAGGADDRIYLWDTRTWQPLDKFTGVSDQRRADVFAAKGPQSRFALQSLAITSDGKTLVSAGDQTLVKLWDISQPELSCPLTRALEEAWWVTFTPDGRTVIAGGDDHTVRLWDTHSKRELQVLRGHECLVMAGAVSPDGKVLATGDYDGTIQLWEISEDRTKRSKHKTLTGHKGKIRALAFSPDGTTLASGSQDGTKDGAVRLWEVATGKLRCILTMESGNIFALAFHPGGRCLAAAGGLDETVRFWDPSTGKLLGSHSEKASVRCLAYSPDGAVLALGLATKIREGTVMLRRADTSEELAHLDAHTEDVRALAFSPDGTRLATSGQDRLIKLWHVNTAQELLTIKWQQGTITGLAFSPDGQTLASASHDGSVRLWFAPK